MILPVQVTKFSNSTQLVSTEQYNYNSSFWPSAYQASTWSNPPELRYQYLSYDSYGNILSAGKPYDVLNSFLYGYSNQYPIAKIINAAPADVAYTSFEDSGSNIQGNWSIGGPSQLDQSCPFGSYSLNLSWSTYVQIMGGLTATTTYMVSYWSKNGAYTVSGSKSVTAGTSNNGWTYYQHTVAGVASVSITGNGSLDEVKLYPIGSQMTTYTYSPLFGMTSRTDPNNVTTFYEYDSFGRLQTTRDTDRNMVQEYEYHYKGQD